MTVNDYIQQKFQTFGIQLSEADLLDMCLNGVELYGHNYSCNPDDELTKEIIGVVNIIIAKFIPSLLLRATSIGESGFSMSWNIEGIKQYYSFACKQYGLKDELSNKPKCTFL